MEEKPNPLPQPGPEEETREAKAKKKLATPHKDKTEVIIGPTDRSGPDVNLG